VHSGHVWWSRQGLWLMVTTIRALRRPLRRSQA